MNKWAFQAFWTLAEHAGMRVLDAVLTIVLIQFFSAEQFGLFSVYQSWTGIALLFLPTLEIALYREFGLIKSEGRVAQELALYRNFNYFKLLAALVFAFALSLLPRPMGWTDRLALVVLAFALPLSQSFYGFLREILRFEMKTRIVAALSALQRAVLIASVVLVATRWPQNAGAITGTAMAVYLVFGVIWGIPVRNLLQATPGPNGFSGPALKIPQCIARFKSLLASAVLWIHLNGVFMQIIQTLDSFFLSGFGVDLKTVGLYSITLKAANFFQALPVALANPFGVYLGRNAAKARAEEEKRLLLKLSAAFLLLSGALFFAGHLFAEPILTAIGRGKITPSNLREAKSYFAWQLGGILLFCAGHPLSAYLGARRPIKKMFLQVFLPWFVASALLYGWSSRHGGAALAAQANVAVYGVFLVLLLRFFAKKQAKP